MFPKWDATKQFRELQQLGDGTRVFRFWCPGCKFSHEYLVGGPVGAAPRWWFNESLSKPTFKNSLLYQGTTRCHLYLTDGVLQFMGDCSHEFAGKSVKLGTAEPVDPAVERTSPTGDSMIHRNISMRQSIVMPAYTFKPFPTFRYRANPETKAVESLLIHTQDELEALGPEWTDSPAAVPAEALAPAEVPQCAGPVVTFNGGKSWICKACGENLSGDAPEGIKAAHVKTPCEDKTPMSEAAADSAEPSETEPADEKPGMVDRMLGRGKKKTVKKE